MCEGIGPTTLLSMVREACVGSVARGIGACDGKVHAMDRCCAV